MKEILAVFIGSGAGGVLRFGVGRLFNNGSAQSFPAGTLIINIVACFILGTLAGAFDQRLDVSPQTKALLTIGFCGGFSTFSAFSQESLMLFRSGQGVTAVSYILLSVLACLSASYLGMLLGAKL